MNEDETSGRGAILDGAERLIRADGADGWSLAELAEEAGMGVDVVRSQFETEWEVFAAVIKRDERSFEAVTERSRSAPPRERIVAVIDATVRDFDWTYWIELWSLSLRDQRASTLRIELDQRFRALVGRIVRDGVEAGDFQVTDPKRVTVTLATLIDAMATNATLGDSTVRPNYMLDACVAVAGKLLACELSMPGVGSPDA